MKQIMIDDWMSRRIRILARLELHKEEFIDSKVNTEELKRHIADKLLKIILEEEKKKLLK